MSEEHRIEIPGVAGHATVIHGGDLKVGDCIEGDVLHYDRRLTDDEMKRVEAYLRSKGILKPATTGGQLNESQSERGPDIITDG